MTSTFQIANLPAFHVAIIMDGNGRWAHQRRLPRSAGHRAGTDAVRRVVEAAPHLGITALTLYAFSSDNWKRPPQETSTLMALFRAYLAKETPKLVERGVRLAVIGRRDRLPLALCASIEDSELATATGGSLHLRIAVDYSARDAILHAASRLRGAPETTREALSRWLLDDVDLLVRTGAEHRLSDFLLWECAYAELHFTERMWPDFSAADLEAAVRDFQSRERRFGGLPRAAAS